MTLGHVAPADVVAIARQQMEQIAARPSVGLLTLSLVGAVWSLSSGVSALIDTLNQAYRIPGTAALVARAPHGPSSSPWR